MTGKQDERIRKELEGALITSVARSTVRGETQTNDLADFTVNTRISFTHPQLSPSTNVLPGVFGWCTIWTEAMFSLILSVVYSLNYPSSITNTNNKTKWYCRWKTDLLSGWKLRREGILFILYTVFRTHQAVTTWQRQRAHLPSLISNNLSSQQLPKFLMFSKGRCFGTALQSYLNRLNCGKQTMIWCSEIELH